MLIQVKALLQSLPQEKWVFTNCNEKHAKHALQLLGIEVIIAAKRPDPAVHGCLVHVLHGVRILAPSMCIDHHRSDAALSRLTQEKPEYRLCLCCCCRSASKAS